MNATRFPRFTLAIAVLIASANVSRAGFYTTGTFTNDATTGISTSKTYTHTIDLNNASPPTINGVAFANGGIASGPNYTSNWQNPYSPYATSVGGNIGSLLSNFYYGPDSQSLTLTGLTPGVIYTYTTYTADWGGNSVTFGANDPSATTITTDRGTAGGGQGKTISYSYIAPPSGQITLTANAVDAGNSMHNYGFTNEVNTTLSSYTLINDLHNTGVSTGPGFTGTSGALTDNAVDPNYVFGNGTSASGPFSSPVASTVATASGGFPIGPWLGDNATSAWTTPGNNTFATNTNGFWAFTTNFTTPGLPDGGTHTALIAGQFSADNQIEKVFVDGVEQLGITGGGFDRWTAFTINALLANGTNHTITWVTSSSGALDDPTGLRVEFGFAGFVPEPSSLTLLGLGTAGLFGLKRRRISGKS